MVWLLMQKFLIDRFFCELTKDISKDQGCLCILLLSYSQIREVVLGCLFYLDLVIFNTSAAYLSCY